MNRKSLIKRLKGQVLYSVYLKNGKTLYTNNIVFFSSSIKDKSVNINNKKSHNNNHRKITKKTQKRCIVIEEIN